jgi:hypothetical protein
LFEPPWLNRTIYRTRNENANHYTTQAVHLKFNLVELKSKFYLSLSGVMVSIFISSAVDCSVEPGRFKQKTMKLEFAASLLSMQH